ncbi:metal-dependent protein hydrolase [Piedraia hortae CBS 480.64]|uniref:Metal-dependent protein hydrolase n=1 Tax=Piedraia hortae CBS 480.64 TaxID=1314780 RepID=A0A6A7CA95_9PEZI|nr:metal-dependent protein hydrolase [Piedraia hortae CBS 480.64]
MPQAKKLKMSHESALIGTHNGQFHADEALAVYLLRLLPNYTHASLVRTRDPDVLKTCTVVVDVGGEHDHEARRYDHHQRGFEATFPGKHTKLSSAGLVWMHYGKDIINAVTGLQTGSEQCGLLHQKLYDDMIEAFDANDNGISVYDPAKLREANIKERFNDKGFSIASVVSRYNYALSGTTPSGENKKQIEEDARFQRASSFVGEQFRMSLDDLFASWLPARDIVKEAFQQRTEHDSKGRIIVIPYRDSGVPWADHLFSLEDEAGTPGQVLYALFAESGSPDSKWRVRAVSLKPGSFESRKSLPEQWRGVRDDELSKVNGIPGCIFVHASGFIGGNKTFEGALQMARKAADA